MVITADTKEQLDLDTETVLSSEKAHVPDGDAEVSADGWTEYGAPSVRAKNQCLPNSHHGGLAVLMPFKVQEIMDKGGIYFGEKCHFPQSHHVQQGKSLEPVRISAGRSRLW